MIPRQSTRRRIDHEIGRVSGEAPIPEARRLASLDPKRILAAVVDFYEVEPALLAKRHDPHRARAAAPWVCRRHTEATVVELAAMYVLCAQAYR
jgi:hypothetical protein